MSKFFDEAFQLTQIIPLPKNIIEKLDAYFELVPEKEKEDFLWLYESVTLETNLMER
tara:strand:- start:31 stop:201 length:171 start_codon:yes stop_codon:yes gene_type:complete